MQFHVKRLRAFDLNWIRALYKFQCNNNNNNNIYIYIYIYVKNPIQTSINPIAQPLDIYLSV